MWVLIISRRADWQALVPLAARRVWPTLGEKPIGKAAATANYDQVLFFVAPGSAQTTRPPGFSHTLWGELHDGLAGASFAGRFSLLVPSGPAFTMQEACHAQKRLRERDSSRSGTDACPNAGQATQGKRRPAAGPPSPCPMCCRLRILPNPARRPPPARRRRRGRACCRAPAHRRRQGAARPPAPQPPGAGRQSPSPDGTVR